MQENIMVRDGIEYAYSVIKRKCGESVRVKEKNMYHEAMLKYVFYNAMIYYDAAALLFGKNRN